MKFEKKHPTCVPVSLKQNVEEKGPGKGIEVVWDV
jgi:hypothetical protein